MAHSVDLLVNRLRSLLDPARHEKAPDGELLGRWVLERDSRAFAALVWRHRSLVWRVASSLLHQPEDAEDVFQATFLVLARKASSLQRRSSLAGWLYQTAHKLSAAGLDPLIVMSDVATGKRLKELQPWAERTDQLAMSPDGRWLASWASSSKEDHDIRVWDVDAGKLVQRLRPSRGAAFMVFFSADSSQIVSGGSHSGPVVRGDGKSGQVQLWDVASGREVRSFTGGFEGFLSVAMTADGRMVAIGCNDRTLRLWEVASGAERRRITGHETFVESLDFSPNGRLLAAASDDAPVYIWDVYGLETTKPPTGKLTKEGQEKLWQRLADTDGAEAFAAVCQLIGRPGEAVTLLEEAWKRSPPATPQQIEKWMVDLDSNQLTVRKTATAELEKFGIGHEELIRKAFEKAGSLEMRQRLETVLGRMNWERLRRTRMLEILEQVGTARARQFLQALAAQTEDLTLSREAATGLKRLAPPGH